jgi:DnaK suppressor protein
MCSISKKWQRSEVQRSATQVCLPQNTRKTIMERMDIEQLRRTLESQRQEILSFLNWLQQERRQLEADSTPEPTDHCVSSSSKESLFEQSNQRRTLLRLLTSALQRIAEESFGVCVGCGKEIQIRRLEAVPWTQFCLGCQQAIEEEVGASLSAHMSAPAALRRVG